MTFPLMLKDATNMAEFLHYMEETRSDNAVNSYLKEIQDMVDTVKKDKEVSLEYMKFHELEERLINQGRKEGREEEKANTEREHQRAEKESQRAEAAEKAAAKAALELEALSGSLQVISLFDEKC